MHTRWDQKHICFIAQTHTKINIHVCIYVCIYILWLATKLHNSSISRDLIIVPTILCKCAVWSTLWTSWSRFETGKWGRGRTARAPVCNNNETTAHQHCGAVTKSMSNCIRAAALQQWAFKLIWLAVKPHAGARAHTRGHTRTPPSAQTRARADTETHARTHIHTHTHIHTRWIKHWTRTKWSDIAACTGVRGKSRGSRGGFLPWAFCRGVSHHHTFSYFSEFTKIVSKAVCG